MLCSKSFKLGFSSTWTENFQMYKLGFEEAEEPEIKLVTFIGSWRKQESSSKSSISASLIIIKPLTVWITSNLWKILKEVGIPSHLTGLLRNRKPVKKQQLEPDMKQRTGSKLGRVLQGYILSPCLFNLYAEYIMRNPGLDETQAGIKIAGRNINSLR